MRILTYTTLFPNNVFPNHGVFIKERMKFFSRKNELKVVAPVPYFPDFKINKRWQKYSQVKNFEEIDNLQVWHPKYFITPKIGMSLYGDYLYWSTKSFVKNLFEQYSFDAIDAHYIYPDGLAAVKLAKMLKKPLIISARGTDINLFSNFPIIKKKIIYTMEAADRLIAVSASLKEKMCEMGIAENKIEVIPNGVDFEKFFRIDKDEAKRKINIPLNRKMIFSAGLLITRKGFNFLIEAHSMLIKKFPKDRAPILLVAGEGEKRSQLEDQIRNLNLEENVKLIGSIPHKNLLNYYNAADIFALVSSREGWPNVIMEAIACGIPVVATKIWGVPEIIKNDTYGVLVEDQNPKNICNGLEKAFDRNWDYEKIFRYSREYNWVNIAQKVENQFKLLFK